MTKRFDKFVVIVTYGRSGSTLLQTVLQTLPGAFIRGENNNAIYPLFRSWKRARNTRYNKGDRAIPAHGPWYGADEIVPRQFGEALAAAFIDHVLKPPPVAPRILGFKEIRFHDVEDGEFPELMDFMRTFFSPCQIVFNTRRSSDVARSSWWKDVETAKVLQMVEDCDRLYADYAAAHPGDSYMVRYDDYARDPEGFRPLIERLGETFDRAAVERAMARQLHH